MIVLDTHAWLWWCADRKQLRAKTIAALGRQNELFVSAISAWELCMLVRKGRLTFRGDTRLAIRALVSAPDIRVLPVSEAIAIEAAMLGDALHGDPADRLIVATALDLRASLVTKDRKIAASKLVPVVW